MAKLVLTGVVPRGERGTPRSVTPHSVLPMLGLKSVPRCWSGLYGTASTREGLMYLLQEPPDDLAIVRATCNVPGGVVTRMSVEELPDLGYLNVRYADADLSTKIDWAWADLAGADDPKEAILTRPDLAALVLARLKIKGLFLIIHPVRIRDTEMVLSIGTVLSYDCIADFKSREPGLKIEKASE